MQDLVLSYVKAGVGVGSSPSWCGQKYTTKTLANVERVLDQKLDTLVSCAFRPQRQFCRSGKRRVKESFSSTANDTAWSGAISAIALEVN